MNGVSASVPDRRWPSDTASRTARCWEFARQLAEPARTAVGHAERAARGQSQSPFGEKVRATVEAREFPVPGSTERITVSVGLALFPKHGQTYQGVLKAANDAALVAKRTRNTVCIAG